VYNPSMSMMPTASETLVGRIERVTYHNAEKEFWSSWCDGSDWTSLLSLVGRAVQRLPALRASTTGAACQVMTSLSERDGGRTCLWLFGHRLPNRINLARCS
jgi:hypothetical protein